VDVNRLLSTQSRLLVQPVACTDPSQRPERFLGNAAFLHELFLRDGLLLNPYTLALTLMRHPREKIVSRLAELSEVLDPLGVRPTDCLARVPGLLQVRPQTLRDSKAVLLGIPRLSPFAHRIIVHSPKLLCLRPATLRQHWEQLEAAMALRPEWDAELQGWLEKDLGRFCNVMIRNPQAYQRLVYLADTRDDETDDVQRTANTWLCQRPTRFARLCPGFDEWLSSRDEAPC
jgi:hypothetical protein